jgi:hypothetical protein
MNLMIDLWNGLGSWRWLFLAVVIILALSIISNILGLIKPFAKILEFVLMVIFYLVFGIFILIFGLFKLLFGRKEEEKW